MDPKYELPEVNRIWSEKGRFERILGLEVANCEAWNRQGIISDEELELIRQEASIDWEVYEERLRETRHDVGSFVFSVAQTIDRAAERQGLSIRPGRFVHLNLTSYDVWDTALAMQVRESIDLIDEAIGLFMDALQHRGMEHLYTLMIGRTHGMHAEPTTFGQKLANYWFQLQTQRNHLQGLREFFRIAKISGPVGSHANIPAEVEEYIAEKLGVRPIPIATQIIPRDWILRYLDHLNELGGVIEKIATDLRDMQRPEICEVEEPFPEGAEGSSIMVHKHNPETWERCCGLARLIAGYVVTARMNVPLWHERDLSNSAPERIILLDSTTAAVYICRRMAETVGGMSIHPERMKANLALTEGIVRSGELLNLMVKKGMSRAEARKVISSHTNWAWGEYKQGKPMPHMKEIFLRDPEIMKVVSKDELEECFDPTYANVLTGVGVSFRRLGWIE
jgi:adenylosuccinate lyase